MASPSAFRVSFYGALALACACLAQASLFFLDWVPLGLLATLTLMAWAYRLEGRWSLSDEATNRVGILILLLAGGWLLYRLPRGEEEFLHASIPWPAGLLPYLGPVLVMLLLVKLFRTKRVVDFWPLQTIGLAMVTLACVLAGEPFFGVLLFMYLVFLLWSMAQYYEVNQQVHLRGGNASRTPLFADTAEAAGTDSFRPRAPRARWHGILTAGRWSAVVGVLGVLMFLALPRQENLQWMPHRLTISAKGMLRTGLSLEGGIDLHHVGELEVSDDPAFEILAFDRRGYKRDLNPNLRWHVDILDYYDHGHWNHYSKALTPVHLTWGLSPLPEALYSPFGREPGHPSVPPADLGDRDIYLCFKLHPQAAGGLVCAETARLDHVGLQPHVNDMPTQSSLFFHLPGTDTVFWSLKSRKRMYSYGQVFQSSDTGDLQRAGTLNPRYVRFLLEQVEPSVLVHWVHDLLARLPDLKEDERCLDANGYVAPEHHARVARALCHYLASSGEYHYSLRLRRSNLSLDPTVDFLLNIREGHCQRFAGGLALMLRSIGIPARLVVGYRGHHHQGEGVYLVRQSMAHSWVQALVQDENGIPHWLTLEPTPSTTADEQPLLAWLSWLPNGGQLGPLWRRLILDYNSDQQYATIAALWNHLATGAALRPLLLLGGPIVVGWFFLRLRRWLPALLGFRSAHLARRPETRFYARLLQTLEYGKLRPSLGQTPLEFAQQASQRLHTLGLEEAAAQTPLPLANLLYQVVFGGKLPTTDELHEAEMRVERLREALQRLLKQRTPAPA